MKDFKVTSEIYELFRNTTVTSRNVKRLIPNYMEYQIKKPMLKDGNFLKTSADKLCEYLTGSHRMSAQEFLDGIQFILEFEGLLRKDNTQEIFHFDGSYLDEGYYQIYETAEKIYIESESALLERICKEIREAKKKEKAKNKDISDDILVKIANDPEIMDKLLNMRN